MSEPQELSSSATPAADGLHMRPVLKTGTCDFPISPMCLSESVPGGDECRV